MTLCNFGLFMAWYFSLSAVFGFLFLMLTKQQNRGIFAILRFISCFWIIVVEEICHKITKGK